MLRPCSKDEFGQYVDFAYGLATDLTKSGYPTYCDEIKTKAGFIERSLKAFDRETEEMLLFVQEGEVQGLIHYFWLPEDRYLETIGFNVGRATEQALSEFLAYLAERFKGYEVYMGFPAENRAAVEYLAGQGFACITDNYNNTAFLDRLDLVPEDGVIPIGRENFESFRTLHRQTEDDMYFTSDRILADLDNWSVFVREEDGEALGAVYFTKLDDGWYEIYGTDIDAGAYDPQLFKELLNAALFYAKRENGRAMTFFCEKEYEKTAIECGFRCVGNYLCYKTRLG